MRHRDIECLLQVIIAASNERQTKHKQMIEVLVSITGVHRRGKTSRMLRILPIMEVWTLTISMLQSARMATINSTPFLRGMQVSHSHQAESSKGINHPNVPFTSAIPSQNDRQILSTAGQ